jgi:hypothetical protein
VIPGTLEDMLLLLRVTLAPLLILAGSLAQRRWGQAVGGRLISLPLTSLPLLMLLSLSDGSAFASSAAGAALAAGVAQSAWCLAYALTAHRCRPAVALSLATTAFALVCVVIDRFPVPTLVAAGLAAVSILAALRWWPAAGVDNRLAGASRAELPVRMVVAAAFTLPARGRTPRRPPRSAPDPPAWSGPSPCSPWCWPWPPTAGTGWRRPTGSFTG